MNNRLIKNWINLLKEHNFFQQKAQMTKRDFTKNVKDIYTFTL